jgi:hypothetical protein
MTLFRALPLIAALILSVGAAQAGEPVQVTYSASPSCPNESAFLEEFYDRTHRVRPRVGDETSWRVQVRITAKGGASRGELVIDGWDGMNIRREATAQTCPEVVTALAMIAALAIDPGADSAPKCPPRAPERRARRASVTPHRYIDDSAAAEPPPEPAGREPGAWLAGAQFLSMGAVGPGMLPGGLIHVGHEPDGPGILGARFRVSLAYLPPSSFGTARGDPRFAWMGARFDGCPVRLRAWRASLLPCGTAGFGWVRSQGPMEADPARYGSWVDLGMLARLNVLLNSWLVLQADAGLVFPLTRYEFQFDNPTYQAYRTAAAAGLVSVGLAVRFP